MEAGAYVFTDISFLDTHSRHFFIKNGLNLFKEKPLNRTAVELQEIPINVYVMFYKALWD